MTGLVCDKMARSMVGLKDGCAASNDAWTARDSSDDKVAAEAARSSRNDKENYKGFPGSEKDGHG